MGLFSKLGDAMFGKSKIQATGSQGKDKDPRYSATQMDVGGLSGSALEKGNPPFQYHFNPRPPVKTPGPAYISPLLQFQEYPRNLVEGWGGIAYKRSFQPFEPLTEIVQHQAIASGTSGVIHDQIYFQPLADTSANTTAG